MGAPEGHLLALRAFDRGWKQNTFPREIKMQTATSAEIAVVQAVSGEAHRHACEVRAVQRMASKEAMTYLEMVRKRRGEEAYQHLYSACFDEGGE